MRKNNNFLQIGGTKNEDHAENLSACWSTFPTDNQKSQDCMVGTNETEGVQPRLKNSTENFDMKSISHNYMNDIFNYKINDSSNKRLETAFKKLKTYKKERKTFSKKSKKDNQKFKTSNQKSKNANQKLKNPNQKFENSNQKLKNTNQKLKNSDKKSETTIHKS